MAEILARNSKEGQTRIVGETELGETVSAEADD